MRKLGFPNAEHGGAAIRACAFDRRLAVLERDGHRILYLNIRLAFDTVCLWHF